MTATLDAILDANTGEQLDLDDLLDILEAEERDDAPRHGSHNGYPTGWLWQLERKKPFAEQLAEAVAIYQGKYGRKPKTVWAHPETGDGDGVSHDRRIGKGYLLLGPLPKSTEVNE